ncbi:MAG: exodeoxyribonuclease VII small subunit [Candidatus Omnitrophica bacterium]|nr:exodeoxyribonuclease VII small subunit [Candidatus Omnitrophota bacterium]
MTKKIFKYQEAIDQLKGILEDLQAENIDVDELSVKVKTATELIKICKEKIQKTEMEVKKIIKKFEEDDNS